MDFEESLRIAQKLQADLGRMRADLRPKPTGSKLKTKLPGDLKLWPRHPNSCVLSKNAPAGSYVYLRDASGLIYVCPDPKQGHGTHLHPQILGYGLPASAAGSMIIGQGATIERLDNYSGTFCFGPEILNDTLAQAIKQGMIQTSSTQLVQWTKHFG